MSKKHASVKLRKRPIEFDRAVFPKNVQWTHDFDYLDKLSPKEQRWMAKFIREYVNGNVKKGSRAVLHKTKALRQDCYQRKNLQNRDLMSILNSNGRMDRLQEERDESENEEPRFHKTPKIGFSRSGVPGSRQSK